LKSKQDAPINTRSLLTKQPEMISDDLDFIETYSSHRSNGIMTVAISIGSDGAVKRVTKIKSTTRPIYEEQVIKQLTRSIWSPAEINGTAVDVEISLEIDLSTR